MKIIVLVAMVAAVIYISATVIKIGVVASEHQADLDAIAVILGN